MDDEFFQINFHRLRSLRRELKDLDSQYGEIRNKLQSVNIRATNLERFLSAEVHASGNKILEQQLNAIVEDEEVSELRIPKEEGNKTNFLAMVLYKSNLMGKGLTAKGLFDLAKDEKKNFQGTLAYTNNVIYKLRKRGFLEKIEDNYFLTQKGHNFVAHLVS